MSDWREVTLGDVPTLQRGFDLPPRDRVDRPYPVVSSSGVTGRHAVAKADPPLGRSTEPIDAYIDRVNAVLGTAVRSPIPAPPDAP